MKCVENNFENSGYTLEYLFSVPESQSNILRI